MRGECVLALALLILIVPTPILEMTEGGHTAWVPDLKALLEWLLGETQAGRACLEEAPRQNSVQ